MTTKSTGNAPRITLAFKVLLAIVSWAALPHCDEEAEQNQGELSISWVMTPEPPVVGNNSMLITVTHAGTPVVGATVEVISEMPAHGHGSSVTPVITEKGGGNYEATPITLQMPGTWRIDVTALSQGMTGSHSQTYQIP